MKIGEIGWDIVDWIQLAKDRDQRWTLVNTLMKIQVPKKRLRILG
jgi:hypothetical protein